MNITRRHLLASAALLPIAACATMPALTPASVIAAAKAAAQGLDGMLVQVAQQYPALIPAATASQLHGDLLLAAQAADSLNTNLPAPSGASTVRTVEGYINAVLNTLAAPPINGLIPAPFNMAVAAAAVIVPQLEAFAAAYIPAAAASPATAQARAKFRAVAPTMTEAQAMAVLQGYAHSGKSPS